MKKLILILSAMILLISVPAFAADVTLTWDKPDDSRVTGYNIYIDLGLPLTDVVYTINNADTLEQPLFNLTEDQWYFVTATSIDGLGNESEQATPLHFKAEVFADPITDPADAEEVPTKLPKVRNPKAKRK